MTSRTSSSWTFLLFPGGFCPDDEAEGDVLYSANDGSALEPLLLDAPEALEGGFEELGAALTSTDPQDCLCIQINDTRDTCVLQYSAIVPFFQP